MPATDFNAQGSTLSVHTAAAATKTITGITAANPGVVTATSHGYSNGDLVVLASIVGMVELNGRVCRVANVTSNTFELAGVDTSSYTAYASGGTASKLTMAAVANCRTVGTPAPTAPEIDVTNLSSTAKEYLLGLVDNGSVKVEVGVDFSDSGQTAMRNANISRAVKYFAIKIGNSGYYVYFAGYVKSWPVAGDLSVDTPVRTSAEIRVTGAWTLA